jgi:hypothetical protein
MAIRNETHALARQVPYLLERAYASADGLTGQTIEFPLRRTSDGALVEPTAAGSSVTVLAYGSAVVSAAALTVSGSVASYTFSPNVPSSTAQLGEGWEVQVVLVIDGERYPFRRKAILCEWVPRNVITAADLYDVIPELQHTIPQAQQTGRGDGTGWAPQIDAAYYAFIRKMLAAGRPIWKAREPTGYYDWLLAKSLDMAVRAIPADDGSIWAQYRRDVYHRLREAEAGLVLQYDDDDRDKRRGANGPVVLWPVGRSRW